MFTPVPQTSQVLDPDCVLTVAQVTPREALRLVSSHAGEVHRVRSELGAAALSGRHRLMTSCVSKTYL